MNPFLLNVCGQVTSNKGAYFLKCIRVNSNLQKTVNHRFNLEDQPIHFHPLFQSKLNFKKKKQLIYLTLEGEDLTKYFNIFSQKFCFNNNYLKADQLDEDDTSYDLKIHPKEFLKNFKASNDKKCMSLKCQYLLNSIKDETDKKILLETSLNGFEELCSKFVEIYSAKHYKYGKDLFEFTDTSNLSKYVNKKLEYFSWFHRISFDEYFKLIKYNLNDDQLAFIDKMEVNDSNSLKSAADLYAKIKSSVVVTTNNQLVVWKSTPVILHHYHFLFSIRR